jgi:hypothetical protein
MPIQDTSGPRYPLRTRWAKILAVIIVLGMLIALRYVRLRH